MLSGEKPEITLVDFGLAAEAGKELEEGVGRWLLWVFFCNP